MLINNAYDKTKICATKVIVCDLTHLMKMIKE